MKETDLNYLRNQVTLFLRERTVAIREIMLHEDILNWFVTTYNELDRVKEVTCRYNHGVYGDITIITTMHRLTIIDNATESASWAKCNDDLVLYDDLTQDLDNMLNYLNMVYLRLVNAV